LIRRENARSPKCRGRWTVWLAKEIEIELNLVYGVSRDSSCMVYSEYRVSAGNSNNNCVHSLIW